MPEAFANNFMSTILNFSTPFILTEEREREEIYIFWHSLLHSPTEAEWWHISS